MLVTLKYNRDKTVGYALKWAMSRNPSYYNFDNIGGDCTNFASQCIFAGCGIMNYKPVFGWFYSDINHRTASWAGCKYLYNFLISNKSEGPFASLVNQDEADIGDIIQLGSEDGSFYHSLVIVSKTDYEPLVAAHTQNVLYKPLSAYSYHTARFLHIGGARRFT